MPSFAKKILLIQLLHVLNEYTCMIYRVQYNMYKVPKFLTMLPGRLVNFFASYFIMLNFCFKILKPDY